MNGSARSAVEEVVRTSYGRLVALVAASTNDISAAEDALSDALLAALRTWPDRGVPDRPEAWLLTVARRRTIGRARRDGVATRAMPALARVADELADELVARVIPDRRLELMFVCAHPAIDPAIHAPLMMQVVLGLDAERIAGAFLLHPATMSQRLVRAKTKIRDSVVPFVLPRADDLPERLRSVADALYAAYGTGWDDPHGGDAKRRGLTDEALRLARLLVDALPDEPEAHGLLALLLHSDARAPARRAGDGSFVALNEQDTTRWRAPQIVEAETHLDVAARHRSIGTYQLLAAIQSVHNRRAMTGTTEWAAIATLYDGVAALTPAIGVAVARAAAHGEAHGPAAGMAQLDAVGATAARTAATIDDYQPYWATRAHLLSRLGRAPEAWESARRAMGLSTDPAVREHLRQRYEPPLRGA